MTRISLPSPGRPRLAVLGAVLALSVVTAPAHARENHYIDSSFPVKGKLLAGQFVALADEGPPDLVLAVLSPDQGRRELRIHRTRSDGRYDPTPAVVVPIKQDVVAWAAADVRDEPGKELVFLTRTGAWSYSLTRPGYANNIRRLAKTDLLYDVPDDSSLPRWTYVLERPGRDALVLPTRTGYSVWSQGPEGYRRECDLDDSQPEEPDLAVARTGLTLGSGGAQLQVDDRGDAFEDEFGRIVNQPLVTEELRIHSPALVDVNGDGRVDLVRRVTRALHVHLATAEGVPTEPTRIEAYPEFLGGGGQRQKGRRRDLEFADLDADGDADLLVRLRPERSAMLSGNETVRFMVLLNDGRRLLPDDPDQLFVLEGASVRADIADVNGDGLADIVMAKIAAPNLLEITTASDLKFSRDTLVFFGLGAGRFERKPSLDHALEFDESTLADAITRQNLDLDCDGDGLADLVDMDLDGHLAIYRVRHESGFFSGESWSLERTPWKRFDVRASIESLNVKDINDDGLGDISSFREAGVTLLLSRRGGAAR
jgi:hypothetical protein